MKTLSKVLKSICVGVLLLSLTSCSKEDASDLTLTLGSSKAYLVEAPAFSCYDTYQGTTTVGSLSANTFSFLNATISWANTTQDVYIYAIKFTFTNKKLSSGGDATCTIAGDELLLVMGRIGNAAGAKLTAAPSAGVPTTVASACSLKCGGIPIVDVNASFEAAGTYEVVAVATDIVTGEQKTVKAKGDVTLLH